MSRSSTVPTEYATFGDLERAFLHTVRRYRLASREIAAGTIVLNAPGMDVPSTPRTTSGASSDKQHQRLELWHSQIILLQNMSAQILTKFPDDARGAKVRQNIETWMQGIEKRSEELRQSLGAAARKQVDRKVVVRNHLLSRELQSALGKKVQGIGEMYLVGAVQLPGMRGEPVMADVSYLRLRELRGPDGFVHADFYVAVAHPTEPGNGRLADMYVSTGADYRLPSRLRWTATARNPVELRRVVMDQLVGEGVIGGAHERDIPIPPNDVQFVHDNVKKTSVMGNQVRVLVRDASTIEDTRDALRRQLSGMVHATNPRNRDVIRDRVDAAKKTITFVFSLPGNLRGRILDNSTMHKLGAMLDLDAATLQRVRAAIENAE